MAVGLCPSSEEVDRRCCGPAEAAVIKLIRWSWFMPRWCAACVSWSKSGCAAGSRLNHASSWQ